MKYLPSPVKTAFFAAVLSVPLHLAGNGPVQAGESSDAMEGLLSALAQLEATISPKSTHDVITDYAEAMMKAVEDQQQAREGGYLAKGTPDRDAFKDFRV